VSLVRFAPLIVKDPELYRVQDVISEVLFPITNSQIIDGILTGSLDITTSFQNLPHGLGRAPVGWLVIAPNASATIWEDAASSNPDVTKFLRVKASAAVTCKFWVF